MVRFQTIAGNVEPASNKIIMNAILTGQVIYSYYHELLERDSFADLGAHFSGVGPFHKHAGEIALSVDKLFIAINYYTQLPLTSPSLHFEPL